MQGEQYTRSASALLEQERVANLLQLLVPLLLSLPLLLLMLTPPVMRCCCCNRAAAVTYPQGKLLLHIPAPPAYSQCTSVPGCCRMPPYQQLQVSHHCSKLSWGMLCRHLWC